MTFDVAVVGGGIMGSATALHLARAGMRTVVLERRGLCMEASGVNAGTLTHRTGPAEMQAYYTRSIRLWKSSAEWLGADVGFRERGGLTIGFTESDSERIVAAFESRKDTEVEIELVHGNRARELEPNLSDRVKLACWFPQDGYANSNRTGYGFHKALTQSGASVRTGSEVLEIEPDDAGFTLRTRTGVVRARRIVIAAGAWVRKLIEILGLEFTQTITCRVNMMNVMERMPRLFERIITHANGGLTLKQPDHGTILIGGGWQGLGSPQTGGVEIVRDNLASNFRLTHSAFAGVAEGRWVRGWLGIEARIANDAPMAGALPGIEGAFVVGCFHSGWTAGPYIGKLMADYVLGRETELPLFDPARVMRPKQEAMASSIGA
jgi:glycine/D-amino acid oxidase-like deaminating enzyme